MPRYFLHLRRKPGLDGLSLDHEGDDIPSPDMLFVHVAETARSLTEQVRSEVIRNWYDCSLEVTDEAGSAVMTLHFADLVCHAE